MKKIIVYGRLRKFLGQSEFEANVASPLEAISFLNCNFKGVEEHMSVQPYTILCGEQVISQDLIGLRTDADIKIIPLVHGNIFGIAAGFLFKFVAKKVVLPKLLTTLITTVGTQMIFSGINNLLTPQRTGNRSAASDMDRTDPSAFAANYSFTGLTNVSQAGVPVNLVFGEILVGSVTVSNGVDTVQVEGEN
jgi:predicted phage tail protein|tara:strand:- start:428 stop:1003 length:576 start_codon:yes stop_codon:yes gene_type:complete